MRTLRPVVLAASAAALVLASTRDGHAESIRMEHGLAAVLPAEEGAKRCYSRVHSLVGALDDISHRLAAEQNGEKEHRMEDVL